MNSHDNPKVESETLCDFSRVMQAGKRSLFDTSALASEKTGRINLDQDKVKNGLGQLVLTLVKLLHELLERQAIRRIDGGSLSEEDVERIGMTLMKQTEEIEILRKAFGLEEEDLNLDLGPLGKLL